MIEGKCDTICKAMNFFMNILAIVLVQAATTKYHRLSSLSNRNLFSNSSRGSQVQDKGAG